MLEPTVVADFLPRTNLLHKVVTDGGHQLPEGTQHWGLRAVSRDPATGQRSSSRGFAYPEPGNWAIAPGPINDHNSDACPSAIGDGLCLATTEMAYADPKTGNQAAMWEGIASGNLPFTHLLLVAYHPADVLGSHAEQGMVRVRRMFVVDDVDGEALIKTHGYGADLRGLEEFDLDAHAGLDYAVVDALMNEVATYEQLAQGRAANIPTHTYLQARDNGLSHRAILAAATGWRALVARLALLPWKREAWRRRAPLSAVLQYAADRQAGMPVRRAGQLAAADIPLRDYLAAADLATHAEIMEAHRHHVWLSAYAFERRNGRSHQQVLAMDWAIPF
ncbi:hypothetical protein [Nonomuraea sp. NPDC049784]|uniref:hypothetical protein n=1 Tax=Nonomuraea sp. NPDC049784 TaxID=3154361 RepID=UPI003408A63A